MISRIKEITINRLVRFLPLTRCYLLKNKLLRLTGMNIATSARIVSTVKFISNKNIVIGSESFVGHDVSFIAGAATISIGANVDIAPQVLFVTGSHQVDAVSLRSAGKGISENIQVMNGAWIGARSLILGGVTIGEKSVIAAGSVVISDVPSRCVYAGVPAKFLKTIDSIDE